MHLRPALLAAAAAAALLLTACASTTVTRASSEPTAREPQHFEKMLVVFLGPDNAMRHRVEDAMYMNVKRANAIQAYRLIPDELIGQKGSGRKFIESGGVDGVVAMRLVGVEKEESWVYSGFWGYWDYAWGMAYDPGYLRTDTTVQVETRIYRVSDEKMLYIARSETLNPETVRETVDDIAKALVKDLKRRGLIE